MREPAPGEPGAGGRGAFVTFEGPDGGGKSTQIARLADRLAALGHEVVRTREPGGTIVGERVRTVLLDPALADLMPETETLLFCAARAELVMRVIRPALERGAIVLCDRFVDATLAYQGAGRGLPMARLDGIIAFATGGLRPDMTLLLDLPVADGLARRYRDDGQWNRLDGASRAFHERVRQGYHRLAAAEPERWRIVDASGPVDEVAAAIWSTIEGLLAVPTPEP
jgi:dTMP kinase